MSGIIKSSIAKKYWMAATGLFLCLFLVGHLAGNLQLFIPGEEGKIQFNEYAKFMTTNPLVRVLSIVTFASVLFHVIDGIVLTVNNRKARPQQYAYSKPGKNSMWTSRNMGVLGTIILAFLITHLSNFWYKMKFGSLPVDSAGFTDLHGVVMEAFQSPVYVIIYVVSMIAIAFHLWHGFGSAFKSLGVSQKKYTPFIEKAGYAFSILIPLGFAIIPIYVFLTNS